MCTKGVHVNVNVQYKALPNAIVANVMNVFESAHWANFMIQYIVPHLKAYTPTAQAVLAQLQAWRATTVPVDDACVICMSTMDDDPSNQVSLPCSHTFHLGCIREWLTRRNTCPHCRHEFKKELSGKYAVTRIETTLVLSEEVAGSSDPQNELVGGQTMNAVVQMTLVQIQTEATNPGCELLVRIHSESQSPQASPQKSRKRPMSSAAAAATLKRLRTG
ncbi:hypothetical protein ACHHYP_08936 [Achlya hypogyna]|uniref:RING-type domain-containing protein n=1 Tax=Achlya hypogyna TaxID=1202772 RepID=A0A1V9ZK01_ACHHY|nr:hypothetical protein ACHHYP_08936 [Achlya hypogyna]